MARDDTQLNEMTDGSGGGGLSPDHIRSQVVDANVVFYPDAGLARVKREMVEVECAKCGAVFEAKSWRMPGVPVCAKCSGVRTWVRGNITHFSPASRRRLMRMLATVHRDYRPQLVTLTYPDTYQFSDEPTRWHRDLRAFEQRFRRAYPGASYIWRLEIVDRKSGERVGELMPHFHLLVFGVSFGKLRAWVPGAWYECVGTGDIHHLNAGTQVAQVKTRRGIMAYASKTVGARMSAELGKVVQSMGASVGRWWGVVVRKNFEKFIATVSEIALSDLEAVRLMRCFRRLMHAWHRDFVSLTAFIDGLWLSRNLPKIVVPGEDTRCFRATGRAHDVPFLVWAYYAGLVKPVLEVG